MPPHWPTIWSATWPASRCSARPDSRAYRLKKFVARNTLPVAAASAIVLALGLGLGIALWQGNEARTQAQRATALNTFVLA